MREAACDWAGRGMEGGGDQSKRRLEQRFGRRFVAENAKYLDRYVVRSAADGAVVTVGDLTKPIDHR